MLCSCCGERQATNGVLCKECSGRSSKLAKQQYLEALYRFRFFIIAGGKECHFDDTEIGFKDTQCTWGLCCSDPLMWPDPQAHLWPHSFITEGRSAPKYRDKNQMCPMDKRGPLGDSMGCFYHCRIFQASKKQPAPNREQAIKLYDLQIGRMQNAPVPVSDPSSTGSGTGNT